jgi:hypothetical protein
LANEPFWSPRYVRLKVHGVDNSLKACLANIELGYSSTSMAKDAIIMSRSLTQQTVYVATFSLQWWTLHRGKQELKCFQSGK